MKMLKYKMVGLFLVLSYSLSAQVTLPWTEDFEATNTTAITTSTSSITGLTGWTYTENNRGRLRFNLTASTGNRAATLDTEADNKNTTNTLDVTLNMSNYNAATDNIEFSFYFADHGDENHTEDRVQVRGSSASTWITLYTIVPGNFTNGYWHNVRNLNVSEILIANGQNFSSTFQIRLSQRDNYRATSTTASDGITFDDLRLAVIPPMWNYSVKTGNIGTTYNWIDCSDGTELAAADVVEWAYDPLDDGRFAIKWPFNFQVYNNSYTTADDIGITTNGFIRFNGIPTIDYVTASDYVLNSTGTGLGEALLLGVTDAYFEYDEEKIFYKVTGTAPNRVLTIEFQNQGIYGNPYLYIDIQASFYETSNKIVVAVGTNNFLRDNADIGIHSGVDGYFHYWQDARYSTPNTCIEYTPPTPIPDPQDNDSYVHQTGITQPAAANILSSTVDAAGAVSVMQFKITDTGTDAVTTKVQRLRIYKATSTNAADWETIIGGVVFDNGSVVTNGVVSVNPNYIDVEFDPTAFNIPNGATQTIDMKVYLKNADQSQAGKTLRFFIDLSDPWFAADYTGSQFLTAFTGADITSNIFTVTFTATKLVFVTEPPPLAYVKEVVNPIVQVAITDAAGNIATSLNGQTITLTNSDGLAFTGNSATVANGVATFSSLTFTATGGPLALNTTNTGGYTNVASSFVTIAVAAVLFEDDFSTDKGWTTSGTALWQRGAQNDDAFGPPSDHTTTSTDNRCYGTQINADYASGGDAYLISPVFDLAGTYNPVMSFWMDMETQSPTNGGTVEIRRQTAGVWGSWIVVDQTDPAYLSNAPNYNDIPGLDNGTEGWTGDAPAGEWILTMIDLSNLTTTGLSGITDTDIIQMRFWFGSTTSATDMPGWYIDDFAITYSIFPGLWKKTATSVDWATPTNWDDGNVPTSTVSVTIPAGAAFYPEIDETAECLKAIIKDGGNMTVKTGGTLNVGQFIEVGEGISGQLTIDGGTLNITNSLHSRTGSVIDFNGGVTNLVDIRNTLNLTDAKGTVNFNGGTINATGNVLFDATAGGQMTGDFVLNVNGNLKISHNVTDNQWPTITGGTIAMKGTGTTTVSAAAANEARMYNLLIEKTDLTNTAGNVHVFNDLEIGANAKFTATAGNNIQIDNDLIIRSEGKSTGSLLDDENITYNGTCQIERYIEEYKWHYLTIPVASTPRTTFHENNFYYYNEAVADKWDENNFVDGTGTVVDAAAWVNPASANLSEPMRGYVYYYYEGDVLFTGDFHTGNKSVTLTNTPSGFGDQYDGWNLIGNPYPSAIDWDLVDKTNLDGAVYFYSDNGTNSFDNYSYYISGGGTPTPDYTGAISVNGAGNHIPQGQAFFVRTTNSSQLFSIDNSLRLHTTDNLYKKALVADEKVQNMVKIKIMATNGALADETAIRFNQTASLAFDSKLDAYKLFPKNDEMPLIYSIGSGDEPIAIQTLNADEVYEHAVKLAFKVPENGQYTLSFSRFSFTDFSFLYLHDKFLKKFVRVQSADSYTFYSADGKTENRFELVFKNDLIDELAQTALPEGFNVIQNNNQIQIFVTNQELKPQNVRVFDTAGRLIFSNSFNGSYFLEFKLNVTGVFLLQLTTENQNFRRKILVE